MSETPSNLPQQPGASDASAPSGSRSVRWLIIASVFLAAMSLLTAFPLMNIGACASWPLALAAAIMTFTELVRARRRRTEQSGSATKGKPGLTAAICVVLLLGSTFLNMMALGTTRASSKSTMSAANLWGIGASVAPYAEKHATYPPSLEAMTNEGLISPKSLISPFDPEAPYDVPGDRLTYSSYIYTPGIGKPVADSDLVIAYERGPFTACEPRLLAPKERWVLFGNGQVRHLTDAGFAEAMRKDKQRRQELGWPTSTEPATSSPGEPSLRHRGVGSAPWPSAACPAR